MPRVITTQDVVRAAELAGGVLQVEAGSVVPTVARQRAEQLGVTLQYGANGASANGNGHAASASRPATNGNGMSTANGSFRIVTPGNRETAILPQPVPMTTPPNAPSGRFVTPADAPLAQPYRPPAAPAMPSRAVPAGAAPAGASAPSAAAPGQAAQSVAPAPGTQRAPGVVTTDYPAVPLGTHDIDIKPNYYATPGMDNIYYIAMELGAALWVVKDREKVLEEILEQKGILAEDEIELHRRSPETRPDVIKKRQAFINQIYGILRTNPG